MTRRGFTIVELLITITVMGILLTLAVVTLTSSQANARDEERRADIEAIANHLEVWYKNGTDGSTVIGRYPTTAFTTQGDNFIQGQLRDVDLRSLKAPGATSVAESFIAATNDVQTASGVMPQPTISQYVYQPLQAGGALCTTDGQECRKFNLYFRLEKDNTVYMMTSRNQ